MRKKIIKYIIIISLLVVFIIIANRGLYAFIIWKIGNESEWGAVDGYIDIVKLISNRTLISPMVKTLDDPKSDWQQKQAASNGLICIDRKLAEKIFAERLKYTDSYVVAIAISGLTDLKSKDYYNTIVPFAESQHSIIRAMLASYLGQFKTVEARNVLLRLRVDKNDFVKSMADLSLMELDNYSQEESIKKRREGSVARGGRLEEKRDSALLNSE